jgi:glycerol-3-phosphate O-acyltransferase
MAARALAPLLRELPLDQHWASSVRAAAERGAVVHVLRNAALVDLLALVHLVRALELPPIAFANDLASWIDPAARLHRASPAEELRKTLAQGRSAVLFMKRAPGLLDRAGGAFRGKSEGDELLSTLVEDVRRAGRDVVFFPQAFVWTRRPERRRPSLVDAVFGPADFPGDLRAVTQFLLSYQHPIVRAGEPLSLRAFLAQAPLGEPDSVLVRRLTYALLRKVERERRAILGPAQKPADRVREEVLKSPKLKATLDELADGDTTRRTELEARAREMLRKLQAAQSPEALRALEMVADDLARRVYSGIDVDQEGLERLREAARKGSVVLLPSHKSHVDYLLLSYVLRKNDLALPLIAAGDNLAFFPMGSVFRRAGAFFIRRSFRGDRLYAALIDAYVRRLVRDGWAIEFFLEGGRSRTGKLLPPKLGLLNMVVDAALGLEGRNIAFAPISIGYERMMEEGAYARELSGEAKRPEDARGLLRASAVLRQKYGRANVQVGEILELGELRQQMGLGEGTLSPSKRRALVTRLAHQVMREINHVTLVTPGALVATILLCHGRRGITHAALVEHGARLVALVRRLGARTAPSLTHEDGSLRAQAMREAALLYVRGGLARQHVPGDTLTAAAQRRARIYAGDDVVYLVPDDKRLLLDIPKNHIVHLFVDRGLVATALLAERSARVSLEVLRARVKELSRLFKYEFIFRADAPFERIFDETVADLASQGVLVVEEGHAAPGPGHGGLDGRGWIAFCASVVRNFVESYRIAARAARTLVPGPVPEKELVARALRIGEQMFLGGEIDRSEAVSGPVIENALAAFVDLGFLSRAGDKLALVERGDGGEGIEGHVASFLA